MATAQVYWYFVCRKRRPNSHHQKRTACPGPRKGSVHENNNHHGCSFGGSIHWSASPRCVCRHCGDRSRHGDHCDGGAQRGCHLCTECQMRNEGSTPQMPLPFSTGFRAEMWRYSGLDIEFTEHRMAPPKPRITHLPSHGNIRRIDLSNTSSGTDRTGPRIAPSPTAS
jgi:hypothetical protein